MDKERVFTLEQVAKHKSQKDCWFIINGRVVDVTEFLEEHPGGSDVLMEFAGKDATNAFEEVGHSNVAKNLLLKYHLGYLQGYNQEEYKVDNSNNDSYKAKEVMKAFVINDHHPKSKSAAFVHFFVPLLVATTFFFGYRYLAGAAPLN